MKQKVIVPGRKGDCMNRGVKCMLITVMLLLAGACVATERNVIGNNFSSNFQPKVHVSTEGGLQYIGHFKTYRDLEARHAPISKNTEFDFYVFVLPLDKKSAKILYIQISNLPGTSSWYSDMYSHRKTATERGNIQLGKHYYETFSGPAVAKATQDLESFIINKGYTLPTCMYQKTFGRIVGENTKFEISYLEDVSYYRFNCADFKNITLLTDKAKQYIKGFGERSTNSFKVSD